MNLESICKKTIWIASFFVLSLPLYYSYNFFFPFTGPRSILFMAGAQIMFAAFLILLFSNRVYRPQINLVSGFVFFLLISLLLSSVLGASFSNSLWSTHERMTGLLMWVHLFLFFVVCASFFKKQNWRALFGFSSFTAVVVSVISLFNVWGIAESPPGFQNGSTLGNTSFMATYLLLNAFLALYLLLTAEKAKKYLIWLWSIVFLIISLGMYFNPGGRAVRGSFFVGLMLLGLFYLAFPPENSRIKIAWTKLLSRLSLFVGSALAFGLALLAVKQGSFIQAKILRLHGMLGRYVVWEKAWLGFLERPLLGWGPENFSYVFQKYFNPLMFLSEYGSEIWFDRVHNVVFDVLVTTGIVGFLAYFGLVLSVIYVLWKGYLAKNIGFYETSIVSVILITHFVQNLTVFDMVVTFMIWFLILAFVYSLMIKEPQEKKKKERVVFQKTNPYGVILAMVFLVFFGKLFVINPLVSSSYVLQAAKSPFGSEQRLEYYQKAIESSALGRQRIRTYFSGRLIAFSRSKDAKGDNRLLLLNEFYYLIEESEKNVLEYPPDLRNYLTLAELYNSYYEFYFVPIFAEHLKDNPNTPLPNDLYEASQEVVLAAENILIKAIEMSPRNMQGYWELSQTKVNKGKNLTLMLKSTEAQKEFQSAFSLLEQALEIEPRLFNSHYLVIRTAESLLGNKDLARKKAKQAIEINPLWQPSLINYLLN